MVVTSSQVDAFMLISISLAYSHGHSDNTDTTVFKRNLFLYDLIWSSSNFALLYTHKQKIMQILFFIILSYVEGR